MKEKENSVPGRWMYWLLMLLSLMMVIVSAVQCFSVDQAFVVMGCAEENSGIRELYGQEMLKQYFQPVLIPTAIYLALMVGCVVLGTVKSRTFRRGLLDHAQASQENGAVLALQRREKHKRRVAILVCSAFCALCLLFGTLHLMMVRNMVQPYLEATVGFLLLHTLPWLTACFAAVMVLIVYCQRSFARIEYRKAKPPQNAAEDTMMRLE